MSYSRMVFCLIAAAVLARCGSQTSSRANTASPNCEQLRPISYKCSVGHKNEHKEFSFASECRGQNHDYCDGETTVTMDEYTLFGKMAGAGSCVGEGDLSFSLQKMPETDGAGKRDGAQVTLPYGTKKVFWTSHVGDFTHQLQCFAEEK